MRLSEQEYQDLINRKHDPLKVPAPVKPNKFHNHITEADNIRFHSKKEANYYAELVLRVKAGEILYFHRQIPVRLKSKIKYIVDFLEFWADGSVHYVEVKGMRTKEYIMKLKLVADEYPHIRIEEK